MKCILRFVATLLVFLPLISGAATADKKTIIDQLQKFKSQSLDSKQKNQSEENLLTPFIIGGNNASRGEYDEFALVVILDNTGQIVGLCGGSLISPNKVLTAAHCSQEPARNYAILPNFYSFNDNLTEADFSFVSRVVDHPRYNERTADFDIGIITMSRSFSSQLARVHRGSNLFNGTLGTAIGTGLTRSNPPESSPILQEVLAPIVSNGLCSANWLQVAGIDPITERMMCAGFPNDSRGTCSGDSGAALFVNINGQRTIVGTTSFGLANCEANRANQAYARLSTMTDFILGESPRTQFVALDANNTGAIAPVLFMLLGDEDETDAD